MAKKREVTISLAAKCQLLFGFAVLVIIAGALMFPWQRMEQLANREPFYEARVAADMALRQIHQARPVSTAPGKAPAQSATKIATSPVANAPTAAAATEKVTGTRTGGILQSAGPGGSAPGKTVVSPVQTPAQRWASVHLAGLNYPQPRIVVMSRPGSAPHGAGLVTRVAIGEFLRHPRRRQYGQLKNLFKKRPVYQYAAAVRATQSCVRCHAQWESWFHANPSRSEPATASGVVQRSDIHPLVGVVRVDMPVHIDEDQLLLNHVVIVISGIIGGFLAIIVFYLITTRLILQPVRVLKNTAEKVAQGDLHIRSAISTGDEFQQLSETFNTMLATLKASQDQLEATNRSLDTRVGELAQSNVDLFQANRVKSEFLTNVSHELRTPLNAIIGFAELLSGNPQVAGEPRMVRYVENIQTSARQLLELINDLLDLARIEAGKLVLRMERVNPPDVCESLMNFMRPLAHKKGIELSLNVNGPIPLITTDPGRLQQILYNFLSNAIKFTPADGQVRLEVSMAAADRVKLSVIDTGPGISPDHQEEIFEKFRQLDASVTREYSGTGLGLAISRELAGMLNSQIELVSSPGKGASFSLIIPVGGTTRVGTDLGDAPPTADGRDSPASEAGAESPDLPPGAAG